MKLPDITFERKYGIPTLALSFLITLGAFISVIATLGYTGYRHLLCQQKMNSPIIPLFLLLFFVDCFHG